MKTNFTITQLQQIRALFNQGFGSRKIAKIMRVNRSTIIRAYKQLELDSASVKLPRLAHLATDKKCKICEINKPINQFRKRIKGNRISYETYCLNCEKEQKKIYSAKRYKNNKNWYIKYKVDNLSKIKIYQKKYREENKEKLKEKRKLNRKKDNEKLKIYNNNRRKIDPEFKLRCYISNLITFYLKKNNSSKNGNSCLDFLPGYDIPQLKKHLEDQFEWWMNWKNHGVFNSDIWKDDDPTTWTWQLDHRMPQSDLPYTSMEDENFKICWSLDNLRPLSAKQNCLDGVRRTRHNLII